MARYIDADKVLETAKDGWHGDFGRSMADITSLKEVLEDTPTDDVVEVVRCKECILRGREDCAMFYRCDCGEQHTWEGNNDYCSWGERKGGKG